MKNRNALASQIMEFSIMRVGEWLTSALGKSKPVGQLAENEAHVTSIKHEFSPFVPLPPTETLDFIDFSHRK